MTEVKRRRRRPDPAGLAPNEPERDILDQYLDAGDVRLDASFDPDSDHSLMDRFVSEEVPNPEDEYMNRFIGEEIERALATLPRDAKVLRLYFGLNGGREHTLEEIGPMLGVTRERVRQLRDRALKRLREGKVGIGLARFAA